MAIIAIVGGSGQVGSVLSRALVARGHSVRILSRQVRRVDPSEAGASKSVGWKVVDYRDPGSIRAALDGVEIIVFTVGGTKETAVVRAVVAEAAADQHLLYLSIVGIDRLPMSYYRAKLASEAAVKASGKPWTILRATQFHSLAYGLLRGLARTPWLMFVPRMRLQPVGVVDTAERLADLAGDLAQGPPLGDAPELGGPEVFDVADLARQYLASCGKKRRIIRFKVPGKLGKGFAEGANLTPDHLDGTETFGQYLQARAGS